MWFLNLNHADNPMWWNPITSPVILNAKHPHKDNEQIPKKGDYDQVPITEVPTVWRIHSLVTQIECSKERLIWPHLEEFKKL